MLLVPLSALLRQFDSCHDTFDSCNFTVTTHKPYIRRNQLSVDSTALRRRAGAIQACAASPWGALDSSTWTSTQVCHPPPALAACPPKSPDFEIRAGCAVVFGVEKHQRLPIVQVGHPAPSAGMPLFGLSCWLPGCSADS